jgi:hypothetical protein
MGLRKEDCFPGRYLRTVDVKDQPPRNAVISHVVLETVGQGADAKEKPVVYFESEDDKPMVLNVTNFDTLAEAFGADCDDWAGCAIRIFVAKTRYAGKAIDGIRVEPVKKNGDGFPA